MSFLMSEGWSLQTETDAKVPLVLSKHLLKKKLANRVRVKILNGAKFALKYCVGEHEI